MNTALDCFISAINDMDLIGTKAHLTKIFRHSAQYPRKKKKRIRRELTKRLILIDLLIKF